MPHPLVLPRLSWGAPHAPRRALLVHGLGSNGALMWRYGTALADDGWRADAVDLRGHGTAPRALDYTIDAYALDLAGTRPTGAGAADDDAGWDLVVAHSLGGAASVVTAAADPTWTKRLVLIDPAIVLAGRDREIVRASQEAAFADPTDDAVRALHPTWHPHDIELKALSASQASRWAVEQTGAQNDPWDVRAAARALRVPTHVIAGDPSVYALFVGDVADEVTALPGMTASVVTGAGHSPHRDLPTDTIAHLRAALESMGAH